MKDTLISLLAYAKDELKGTVAAVPDDKMTWSPLDKGRSALDLVSSAAQIARMTARIIESRGEWKSSPEYYAENAQERAAWTRAVAMEQLESTFEALTKSINDCSDTELEAPVTLAMRDGITLPLGACATIAYRGYMSRFGQINYIQTLYGDTEYH